MLEEAKKQESVSLCDSFHPVNAVKVFQALDECDSSHDQIYMKLKSTRPATETRGLAGRKSKV